MFYLNRTYCIGLAIIVVFVCHCGEDGPQISVDLNIRNLCDEFNVSGEVEARCETLDNCSQCGSDPDCIPFDCWYSSEDFYQKGFCRQCEGDNNCPESLPKCDHGWCHKTCTNDNDCILPQRCVPVSTNINICRKPHIQGTAISFCNTGDQDLEIYVDKTELHGNDGACVFSRFLWEPADQDTIVLAAHQCDVSKDGNPWPVILNVMYTPPDVGEFRGYFYVFSNATNINPLPVLFCANALEAKCETSVDKNCPECTSCSQEDFQELMQQNPTPNCSTP